MADLPPPLRRPLLLLGFVSLVIGVGAGLARLGWNVSLPSANLAALHGPLMVSGFFGTVIALERAVGLGRLWAYGIPLLSGVGGIALIAGAPQTLGAVFLVLGSFGLVETALAIAWRQRALFTAVMTVGALCWLLGNLAWLAGRPPAAAVPWWALFLVLTIAGERLELTRFLPPSATGQSLFLGIVVLLVAAVALGAVTPVAGKVVLAAVLVALSAWLVRYDIARRTVHETGFTRFIAVCLLGGYAWLAVGGLIGLAGGGMFAAGPTYDATLHAVFLGFVFSMVFGHAGIILPAVTRFVVPYRPVFYLHLGLLHLTLLVRLGADLAGAFEVRQAAAMGNALTLLVFLVNTVAAVVRGRRT
jgi:hypothetical protein